MGTSFGFVRLGPNIARRPLRRVRTAWRVRCVVTDGVFSMEAPVALVEPRRAHVRYSPLPFQVGRFAAFGRYQITTSPSIGSTSDASGVATRRRLFGPAHTLSGGLGTGLGAAREDGRHGGA
jgi:hypothetical protein